MTTTEREAGPRVVHRTAQPYVFVARTVFMDSFAEIADRLGGLFGWLAERGATPAGPPFFKYNLVNMPGPLEIEAGVPVAEKLPGEGEVSVAVLPVGEYLTVRHVGHPDELMRVTGDLLAWAEARGLDFDKQDSPEGERWMSRLELYLSDPAVQPDMTTWETELAFKLRD